jgi:hypothetical protein
MKNGITQFREFLKIVQMGIPTDLPRNVNQNWIDKPQFVTRGLRRLFAPSYPVEVDLSVSLETLIDRVHFRETNPLITSRNFPDLSRKPSGKEIRHVELINFTMELRRGATERNLPSSSDREMTNAAVLKEFDSCELDPADVRTLLWALIRYPKWRKHRQICALGSAKIDGSLFGVESYWEMKPDPDLYLRSVDCTQQFFYPDDLEFLAIQREIPKEFTTYLP